MKVNAYKPSFTGYSNIFANNINSNGKKLLLLSMKLDNLKENDLDKFQEIKKIIKFPPQPAGEDILSLFYVSDNPQDHFLFMNGKRLLWGEELKYLSENVKPKNSGAIKELRDVYMKVYTFLARVTRRMFTDNKENMANGEFYRVIEQSIRSMTEIIENPEAVIDITNNAIFRRDINHNEIAGIINSKIDRSMKNFFEV